jgi:molybdopterin-guanine dinucleotide biosynthesis protein A
MNQKTDMMVGAILAGGLSSRFGSDKARAVLDPKVGPVTLVLSRMLRDLGMPVTLLCGAEPRYEDFEFQELVDLFPGKGPLGGLHVALTRFFPCAVVLLSCDMPLVSSHHIQRLISERRPGSYATVFGDAAGPLPFPGIYESSSLQVANHLMAKGEGGIKDLLSLLPSVTVLPSSPSDGWLADIDTPQDFEKIKEDLCLCQAQWN